MGTSSSSYDQILLKNYVFSKGNESSLGYNEIKKLIDNIYNVNNTTNGGNLCDNPSYKYYENIKYRKKVNKYRPGHEHEKIIISLDNLDEVDIDKLISVHTLKLCDCTSIINANKLKFIDTLIFKSNRFVIHGCIDIKNFGSVKTLILKNNNIKRLDGLQNVHTLDISGCGKIIDISMLYNVHTLCITDCKEIKNVGSLRKLRILIINKEVYGLNLLANLRELYLSNDLLHNKKMTGEVKKLIKNNSLVKIMEYWVFKNEIGKKIAMDHFMANQGLYYGYKKIKHREILKKNKHKLCVFDGLNNFLSEKHNNATLVIYKNYPYEN
jgi:hypothetical protein